jgi:hypothetical protein
MNDSTQSLTILRPIVISYFYLWLVSHAMSCFQNFHLNFMRICYPHAIIYSTHFIFPCFIIKIIIPSLEYKLWSSSLCNFLHPPDILTVLFSFVLCVKSTQFLFSLYISQSHFKLITTVARKLKFYIFSILLTVSCHLCHPRVSWSAWLKLGAVLAGKKDENT